MTAEADITAPYADAILAVLKLYRAAGAGPAGTPPFGDVEDVIGRLLSYDDGLPVNKARVLRPVLSLLDLAERHDENADADGPILGRHYRDLARRAENEARHAIRHTLTLEGPDL